MKNIREIEKTRVNNQFSQQTIIQISITTNSYI